MRVKDLLLLGTTLIISACGLTPAKPYTFYTGPEKPVEEISVIEVQRSFGGPAVILKAVNGKDALSYKSMSGYPADSYEANRLEPRIITVQPSSHKLLVVFAFIDIVNKGFSKFSVEVPKESEGATFVMARYEATLPFKTRAGYVYQVNYNWKQELAARGVTFQVLECDAQKIQCINLNVPNVNPKPALQFHTTLPLPENIRGQ